MCAGENCWDSTWGHLRIAPQAGSKLLPTFVGGVARAESHQSIPFLLEADRLLVIVVDPETNQRSVTSVAEAVCDVTSRHGITEILLTDHDLVPMNGEDMR